jgi:hypothetical protein
VALDDGRNKLPKDKRFIVRVLVPCYTVRICGVIKSADGVIRIVKLCESSTMN